MISRRDSSPCNVSIEPATRVCDFRGDARASAQGTTERTAMRMSNARRIDAVERSRERETRFGRFCHTPNSSRRVGMTPTKTTKLCRGAESPANHGPQDQRHSVVCGLIGGTSTCC